MGQQGSVFSTLISKRSLTAPPSSRRLRHADSCRDSHQNSTCPEQLAPPSSFCTNSRWPDMRHTPKTQALAQTSWAGSSFMEPSDPDTISREGTSSGYPRGTLNTGLQIPNWHYCPPCTWFSCYVPCLMECYHGSVDLGIKYHWNAPALPQQPPFRGLTLRIRPLDSGQKGVSSLARR